MAKDLLLPGNIIGLHRKAVEKLSKSGNGDAALLYLCLAAGQTSGALPWGAERVEAARSVLIQLGLLRSDTPVAPQRPVKLADERPPEYTSEDIAQAMNNEKFKPLVPAMEHLLGKILSPSDLKILYMIYDFLGLPPEVILTLAGWCNEKAKKGGPGRTTTLPLIRREAVKWEKAGITTLDAADAHLQRMSRLDSRGTEILQLLFGESRTPVPQERDYLESWIRLGFSDELLLLARDRTLFNLQEFKWSYMNSILNRWHKEGLTTPAAVEATERGRRPVYQKPQARPSAGPSPRPQRRQPRGLLRRGPHVPGAGPRRPTPRNPRKGAVIHGIQ